MQVLLLQGDYGVTVTLFIICTTLCAMGMKLTSLNVLIVKKILFPAAVDRLQSTIIGTITIQTMMSRLWSVSQVCYTHLL